jgi:hypothetical protein
LPRLPKLWQYKEHVLVEIEENQVGVATIAFSAMEEKQSFEDLEFAD